MIKEQLHQHVLAGYPALKRNDKGVYVLVLQDALNTLGYSTGGLDGVYGSATNTAVQAFQKNIALMKVVLSAKHGQNCLP